MLSELNDVLSTQIPQLQLLWLLLSAMVHVIFAGAVAKDSGNLAKLGHPTLLVSGMVWALATLIGGVWVAAIYWFMHRSSFFRPQGK